MLVSSILDWPYQYIGLLIALSGTLVSLLSSRRNLRREEAKERPYFVYDSVLLKVGEGKNAVFSYSHEDSNRLESYEDGGPLILRLRNDGPSAREFKITPIGNAEFHDHPFGYHEFEGRGFIEATYLLRKDRVGKKERFRIHYETPSGTKEIQIWEHEHGRETARRIKTKRG